MLGKFREQRKFAENVGKRFGVAGAGGRFAVVLGKFERFGQQEGVEARGGAGAPIADGQAREALFFGTQMKLREKAGIFAARR